MKLKFPEKLLRKGAAVSSLPTGVLNRELGRAVRRGEAGELSSEYWDEQQRLKQEGRAGQEAGTVGMGATPTRVHEPGGDLVSQLVHPGAFTTVERLFQSLPEDGMFSPATSPSDPFQFELGVLELPTNTAFWMTDYEFGTMLFDGVNPGDFSPAPPSRFRGSIGFDVQVNESRIGNIQYQLDPVAITTNRQAFNPNPTGGPFNPTFGGSAVVARFDRAAANSFATTASSGLATLPARRPVQGPSDNENPWTWVVRGGQRVALRCIIFRPIQQPIAAIFGRLAGRFLHQNLSDALIERVRPV